MSLIRLLISLVAAVVFIAGCEGPADSESASVAASPEPASPPAAEAAPEVRAPGLAEIAEGSHRSAEARARNSQRHPVETLEFFGLRPDSHVVEIWPGGGWYTEIIAPYVREQGKYYAANWDPNSEIEFIQNAVQAYVAKLAEYPDLYDAVEMTVLMPPDQMELAPPGTADLVLTFRNIHNWMPRGSQDDMFAAMYRALKPGGALGVVEHRGNPEVPQDPKAKSGYVNEAAAIAMAEKAGFVFEARSEINANPADTKDYEAGVWSLPPTLRLGDQDKERFLEIGESDRFTLLFRKPAA